MLAAPFTLLFEPALHQSKSTSARIQAPTAPIASAAPRRPFKQWKQSKRARKSVAAGGAATSAPMEDDPPVFRYGDYTSNAQTEVAQVLDNGEEHRCLDEFVSACRLPASRQLLKALGYYGVTVLDFDLQRAFWMDFAYYPNLMASGAFYVVTVDDVEQACRMAAKDDSLDTKDLATHPFLSEHIGAQAAPELKSSRFNSREQIIHQIRNLAGDIAYGGPMA